MTLDELKAFARSTQFSIDAEGLFFDAMNAGYASFDTLERGPATIEMPGSTLIPYAVGLWKVVDLYWTTPLSAFSFGTTVLSYDGIPVWRMQYSGFYDEDAIPCLKAALSAAYRARIFNGGRGPYVFKQDGFTYNNYRSSSDPFMSPFASHEFIYKESATGTVVAGHHEYGGGGIID